jgi:hypothetical protein
LSMPNSLCTFSKLNPLGCSLISMCVTWFVELVWIVHEG